MSAASTTSTDLGVSSVSTTSGAIVTEPTRSTTATRDLRQRTRLRSSGLDQKALAETEWVMEDLRRIAVISAMMAVGLALAYVLLVIVGLGDFY
jgi:hypothetical protein